MSLTPEQEAAVRAQGPAVAVSAGAGTGKTHVLTARYLRLALEEGVEPRRILAVTFTEKAARQMKDRIRAALARAGRNDLSRAAEFAPISTIHAFLARALRERALDAGVDPRFALADEATAELLLEEALTEVVDGLNAGEKASLSDVAGGEETILALHAAARATPHAMPDLRPVEFDEARFRTRVQAFLEGCEACRAGGKTAERLRGLRALAPRLRELDAAAAGEFVELTKGNVATDARGLFAEGKLLAAEFSCLACAGQARRAGAMMVTALSRLEERYTSKKRAEGLLDFADLEREGLRLLLGEAGEAVAADFPHLLVDEYQDTSRIQEAILDRLARGRVRFGVGDAKQSIYRFRYADAAVFQDLLRRSQRHDLSGSWRSRPEVLAFHNALFRRLFAGSGVEAQDLRAEARFRPKEAPCVELLAPKAENAGEGRRREAILLARRLREIVEERQLRLTREDRPDEPLGYRHCALLLRATTNLPVYERALAAAGVPYVVIKGRGYYAAREVVDLAQLLLALADPFDRYRAAAAMTSLFCGVPDGDLLALRDPLPLDPLRRERPAAIPPERWERLTLFARRFERWRADLGRVDTGDLVERILAETRVADLLLVEPDGRRRHANLAKALRRARAVEGDPVHFARELLQFRERERRESEAPISGETDDAVRIMTVHAAKGLEFPLVAVGDLGSGHRPRKGPILHPDGRFAFRLREEDANVEPPGFGDLKEWEESQEHGESLRLLYVAFTRAEEHLILCGAEHPRIEKDGLLRSLLDAPPEGVRVERPERGLVFGRPRGDAARVAAAIRRADSLPPSVERDGAAADRLLERVHALRRDPPDLMPYVVAVADLLEFGRCPRRYRLGRMLGIEIEESAEGEERPGGDEHTRRELGTALHAILAEADPGAVPDAAEVRRHLPGAADADIGMIQRWCRWLAGLPLLRGLRGPNLRKEMPFLAQVEGLAVRGVIDLYCSDPPLLVDYKAGSAARPEDYEIQVAVYLAALGSLHLPAPAKAHLLFVDAGQVVEVDPPPLAGLVADFRRAHAGGGRFDPRPGPPCAYCRLRVACEAEGLALPAAAGSA